MKQFFTRRSIFVLFLCFAVTSIYLSGDALAQPCEEWVAKVVSVQGVVEAQKAGETQWQQVKMNDTFCPGDKIRVQDASRADVALVNQPVMRLDQNTTITLGGVKEKRTSLIELVKGAAHFFSRARQSLEVDTAFVNAGVEGTEFVVKVDEDKTLLSIFEGRVLASNQAGSLSLTSGQSAEAQAGKAPVLRVVARPRDAVQWALYYPPVIYVPPGDQPTKEDMNDPRFLTHRASLMLAVGRVDEASADLKRALRLKANYSDAYALQSIIAVVQNDKDKALKLAQKAVESDVNSGNARIALSYAQQARFDLEGARASLEEAVRVDPKNALAWARLAEMWSSFGDLDRGLDAAKKAVELDPNLARTQTVLGFAYLTQVKTKEAREVFDKAIALDQADSLPRLGLGLAKIRDGDLQAGGRDIEIAASLDPNNSLIRSYLGKLYYEEKRTKMDVEEFAIAKELDPKDPTPWFYDAIAKETTNRPVEALHDMQKAIELNDNQAVYRSRLLLDSDLASRSSSLARIYNNLGFQQRGLVEGWNSVNIDPTNYSAHRFLSDSYSALPRHEVARVSELLQSQLLQPINITPIQPTLAESNLFLISSEGPSAAGFNTYNPLFNRNQATLLASGLGGENDTWAGEGVASGIYNKLSLSAGYSYFDTDGWRKNADQTDKIADVFAQYELSYKTSIQVEYRYRKDERGDTELRFFQDDFRDKLHQETKTKSLRLGLRQEIAPGSTIIGNFMAQRKDSSLHDIPPVPFISSIDQNTDDEKAVSGEAQYLFRSNSFKLVGGGGYFTINADENINTVITPPPMVIPPPPDSPDSPPIIIPIPAFTDTQKINRDVDHTDIYLYSYINFPANVTFTVGGSGDFFNSHSSETPDENQFNPKFGVTWNPFPDTTLRAAVFRTLKRTLITNQTLEPTQVAGFNQFYDDADATDAWRYGGALDQKFFENLYGGAEFSYRDLEVPYNDVTAGELKHVDWGEYLGRAYLFWTPQKWVALRAEYRYERFDRDETFNLIGIEDMKTHSVPLGASFFHPSGLSASIQATYYYQDGRFQRRGSDSFVKDSSDFWIVDVAVNYRLPKRYGFITIAVSNLFDEDFSYQETDLNNPRIQPDRVIYGSVTLAFP